MKPASPSDQLERLLEHDPWLRKLAAELVRDPATADDIVQETWLAAMRAPEVRAPKAWLKRVLGLRLRTHQRRRTVQRDAEALAVQKSTTEDKALIPPHDLSEQLSAALDELPPVLRETLVDHYLHGRTSVAAAAETGTPEGTLRWRLKRGRDLLRESLERRYGEDAKRLLPSLAAFSRPPAKPAVAAGALLPAAWLWAITAASICACALLGWAWLTRSESASVLAASSRAELAMDRPTEELHADQGEPESLDSSPQPSRARLPQTGAAEIAETSASTLQPNDPDAVETRTLALHFYDTETKQSLAGVEAYVLEPSGMRLAGRSDAAGNLSIEFGPDDFHGAGFRRLEGTASVRFSKRDCIWSTVHSFTSELLASCAPGKALEHGIQRGAATLAGRVTGPEGEALVGAELRLGRRSLPQYSATEGYTTTYMPFLQTTDEEGRFEFAGVPPMAMSLRIRAEGHYEALHELTLEPAATVELDLPMAREARCSGTVLDDAGRPVPGARVWHDPVDAEPSLNHQGDPDYSIRLGGFVTEVIADSEGRFVLHRLRGGPLRIWAQSTDDPAQIQFKVFQVERGSEFHWDPVLEHRSPLEIRVLDHEGKARSNCALRILAPSSVSPSWQRAIEVPPGGIVPIYDWIPTSLEVMVQNTIWAGGAPLHYQEGLSTAQSPIEVQLADQTPAKISGSIRDAQGDTPTETFLILANLEMEFVGSCRVNMTDGSFTLDLPPGTYQVSVEIKGLGFAAFGEIVLQPGESTDWNATLPPTAPLRLVDRSGPIRGNTSYRIQAVEGWRTELQRVSVIEDGMGRPSENLQVLPGEYVLLHAHDGQVVSRTMFAVSPGIGGYLDPNGDGPALTAVSVLQDGTSAPIGTRVRVTRDGETYEYGEDERSPEGVYLLPLGEGQVALEALYPNGEKRQIQVELVRRGLGKLLVLGS